MVSWSEGASAVAHASLEKSCNAGAGVPDWTRARTAGGSALSDPRSEDLAAYSFHGNRRPDSSPWQVLNILKPRSSGLPHQLLRLLVRVIYGLEPRHYACLNLKFLYSW